MSLDLLKQIIKCLVWVECGLVRSRDLDNI